MHSNRDGSEPRRSVPETIPFPTDLTARGEASPEAATGEPEMELAGLPDSAGQVIDALETMSRRIDDLARELNCLGYFDDDEDGPRAA
jgi:hypothetical protein